MTLPAVHETSICNRTRAGNGVQLELPMSLRRRLAADQNVLGAFCLAVRKVISSASKN
ncbi:poly-gamma-glutamate hydrolase family protein [Roseovarius sp. S4756]|uniref:poly-gamma-glutamate hydrolase family protein n=1 Tax=Roseovarius maritimus TaxID=3342637 RepID=UPI0037268D7F